MRRDSPATSAEEGGAGGPSRRPPRSGAQRPAPYGRTPRRWLSKLPVASRILPSLFPSSLESAAPEKVQEDHHKSSAVMPDSRSVEQPELGAFANGGPTAANCKVNMLVESNSRNASDGNGLAEIENIIKQKCFSRDETDSLIELLRSRTPDLCHEDWSARESVPKAIDNTPAPKDIGSLAKHMEQVDFPTTWKTSGFAHSNMHHVGSSPIEIAKAHMETPASVYDSASRKFEVMDHTVDNDNSASKFFPTSSTKSPTCWPGAVVSDSRNYLTPRTNRGRTLRHTFSHTPYSGSIFPRSIKRRGDRDGYNNSLAGWTQPSTPFSASTKETTQDRITSVGRGHGAHHKPVASASSKETTADNIDAYTSLPGKGSAAFRNLSFDFQGVHGKGASESSSRFGLASAGHDMSKCTVGSSVHPKSSETAQKILQQLDRTISFPMLKLLEPRQVETRSEAPSVTADSQRKRLDSSTSNGHRLSSSHGKDTLNQEVSDAKKVRAATSGLNTKEFIPRLQDSSANSEVLPMSNSQAHSSSKSVSTSQAATMVLDKSTASGFTFTFPVTTTSNALSEPPPMPTMISPAPASSLPVDGEAIPKFTFGSSSSTNNLVFSFGSSGSSVGADATIPYFKFGSDGKRLSFSLVGKDANSLLKA